MLGDWEDRSEETSSPPQGKEATRRTGLLGTGRLFDEEAAEQDDLREILPSGVVRSLLRSGYLSKEQVAHTPDYELLYGRGIGTGVLQLIRSAIPFEPLPGTAPLASTNPHTNLKDRVLDLEARVALLEAALKKLLPEEPDL